MTRGTRQRHVARPIVRGRLWVELRSKPALTDAGADLLEQIEALAELNRIVARHGHSSLLVLAPYVSPPMGRFLEEHGLSYIDRLGNCHLQLGPSHVVHVRERFARGRRLG